MRTFKALLKREFWEHKGGIFYTPAIMAAVFATMMIVFGFSGDHFVLNGEHKIDFSQKLPTVVETFEATPDEERSKGVQIGLHGTGLVFSLVSLVICLFYALGSLYDERKDRSILFWKSLPVSDTVTVLSKFVSITLLVPVSYFIVITIFQVFFLLYFTVFSWFGGSSGITLWASSNLFGVMFNNLLHLVLASLWLAPLWAWLMLASAWAKKVAFLWGGLPILMIIIAEGWIFQTSRFAEMFAERIGKSVMIQNSPINNLLGGDMFDGITYTAGEVLGGAPFWVGLGVAAIFLAGAIYTRRYRDEA
ncbi:hypothetical protein [Aliikangiella sp. G2MR2-5]|uniref:hypothetical protein n=1 Tax=Aliikangiella sp. G2MR2-5 TaxID=2788943 RepID=UPI0018ABF266|nr:hypothetical protein [Aliikangiella sp. G2MR2-5]